uniref:Uncharacterized protein n=1 Tax=Gallus gallus TaxID=9031 RepID=A0A8V0XPE6_CHICK
EERPPRDVPQPQTLSRSLKRARRAPAGSGRAAWAGSGLGQGGHLSAQHRYLSGRHPP